MTFARIYKAINEYKCFGYRLSTKQTGKMVVCGSGSQRLRQPILIDNPSPSCPGSARIWPVDALSFLLHFPHHLNDARHHSDHGGSQEETGDPGHNAST